MTARLLIGDVFDRMAELDDGSVDLVLTSPPFLALRSYLPADHPDKGKEIGSEPTPAAFLDTLLALTAEWRRVLAPHGSIAVELGDTYSGSGGGGGDYLPGGLREDQPGFGGSAERQREGNAAHWRAKNAEKDGWPLPKSLCGIPHLYHLSLAYGRNLLTGQESPAGSWRVRNVVAWCRPNPPVGALGDKFRPGTSYMTVACVSGTRYFDLDAVRTHNARADEVAIVGKKAHESRGAGGDQLHGPTKLIEQNPAGAPPLDWWEIPTQPYAGSHYATWPAALCERPVKAMCPRRVCTTCGEPSRRIVDAERVTDGNEARPHVIARQETTGGGVFASNGGTIRTTTGWTDCGCPGDHWRTGVVLDPFAGSGTTLAVASGHGRDAIGIDLDARNAELCSQRVGMFLEIDEPCTGGTDTCDESLRYVCSAHSPAAPNDPEIDEPEAVA